MCDRHSVNARYVIWDIAHTSYVRWYPVAARMEVLSVVLSVSFKAVVSGGSPMTEHMYRHKNVAGRQNPSQV